MKIIKAENPNHKWEIAHSIWYKELYKIREVISETGLHLFEVSENGELLYTIVPNNQEEMKEIKVALDGGADVNGWKDSDGNEIKIQDDNICDR